MAKKVRLAVIGGSRGGAFGHALSILADRLELTAVCDLNEAVLQEWKRKYPEIVTFSSYDQLLESPLVDAIYLATPMLIHADQAIQALRAGKHVLSEVIAAHTIEDGWKLIEAVEASGLKYMMAENYCYTRENKMVQQMADADAFGEITYAECGYIHDVRNLLHGADGSLTWRGQCVHDFNACTYPTHSLGPIAKWLGIHQPGGDFFEELVTFNTKSRSTANYFRERFGTDHPGAQPDFWRQGDSSTTLIRTKKGVVVSLRVDIQSARPHNMVHYGLQGTEGAYLGPRFEGEDPLIWLHNEVSGTSGNDPHWDSLWHHKSKWDHPDWRAWEREALHTGHGGGDFFVIREFVSAIQEDRKPAIDVYDAVTWSSLFALSMQSVSGGGSPVKFVDFYGKNKDNTRLPE
ncbi:Gfo/Idh/MocA family protein [Paenibacillus eucommiae]|uniref:Dehydrogenase n=1 Tax=Paenibacillus eucommiae TaxID=1355755 RepID=A0ABS4J662_9BACL|nr:Gfo/Idh/MocA family oxidoreductase [Paenibacillus eucommiae]MBP1995315.1 putative dehydrogenase [Paenibacillus eucommiae]